MAEQRTARALRALPERPNLEHLRKEAKQCLKRLREVDPAARLAVAQLEVARDYGFTSWRRLAAQFRPAVETGPAVDNKFWRQLGRLLETAEESGDWGVVEQAYREEIARHPFDQDRGETEFAIFLAERRGRQDEARAIFARLMQKPTHFVMLGYARFLRVVGEADDDGEEAALRRALALGDNVVAFNHYANFLLRTRQNRDEAERWFRKAAEFDSGESYLDGAMRGVYATLLWDWGDAVTAETWFRLALAKTRMEFQTLLAFAAMLTATGRVAEGLSLLPEILCLPRMETMQRRMVSGIEMFVWFLRYAHGDAATRGEALDALRTRLKAPIRLGRFVDLSRNARTLAADHPAPDLVAALANALQPETGKAAEGFETVQRCPAWSE